MGVLADGLAEQGPVATAYRELLSEEGVPYRMVRAQELLRLSPEGLARTFWALIVPEGARPPLPPALAERLARWVQGRHGYLLLVYDGGLGAGAQPLDDLLGVRRVGRVVRGPWLLPASSPLTQAFDPALRDGGLLHMPGYPPLISEHLAVGWTARDVEVLASTPVISSHEVPVFTLRRYPGGGAVAWLNAPAGGHKVRANDDAPFRVPLRFFLVDVARVPRLVAAPYGIGGLVLNLHLCSRLSLRYARRLAAVGLFTPELPMSFSLAAGPDFLFPGDHLGVDVRGRDAPFLYRLAAYGSLGAQGGWRHGEWGYLFDRLSPEEKWRLIWWNWAAVSQLARRSAVEYAAPNGRHDRLVHRYLAALGYRAVAFPAAFNSPPTRAWFDGVPGGNLWLFGYSATRYGLSPEEMVSRGRPPGAIADDIRDEVIRQAVARREIRLVYLHPDVASRHPDLLRKLADTLREERRKGHITVMTMRDYAEFLDRHQAAQLAVWSEPDGLRAELSSRLSLRALSLALPVPGGVASVETWGARWQVRREGDWLYATVLDDAFAASLRVRLAQPHQGPRPGAGSPRGEADQSRWMRHAVPATTAPAR